MNGAQELPQDWSGYRSRIADLLQAALVTHGFDVADLVANALVMVAEREGGLEEPLRVRTGSWEAAACRSLIAGASAGLDLPEFKERAL